MKKYIYSTLALAVTMLTACTGDYTDWASPAKNDQPATVSFGNGSVTEVGVIDFATIPDSVENVAVCQIKAPTASDSTFNQLYYTIDLAAPGKMETASTFTLNEDGSMRADDLSSIVESIYGKRPTERTITAIVKQWISDGPQTIKTAASDTFHITAIPEAPEIESAYYITGGINNWDNMDKTYKVVNNGGDVYANPTFSITLTSEQVGDGFEFKLTPESGVGGDWSKCITAAADGTEGKLADKNAGGNIMIEKSEGAVCYKLEFNLLDQTYTVTPISFKPFLYFCGSTDGWKAFDQKLALKDAETGIYTGYVYVADPNGWGLACKFLKEQNWDHELNAGTFTGGMDGVTGSNNIEFPAEGVYYITIDLTKSSINAVQITNMNLVGDFNGWNQADDAQQMTWDATNYCFTITNAGVTSAGWKFTANNDWGINLGGALTDLISDGDNISAVGQTIKLYPCRTTSDNIYCTVE